MYWLLTHILILFLFSFQIKKLKLQLEEERQKSFRNDGSNADFTGLENGSDLQLIEMQSMYTFSAILRTVAEKWYKIASINLK